MGVQVWSLLFQRLQAAKTARFVRGFLVFLCHVVLVHGPAALVASTNAVQPGIFLVILQQVCLSPSMCMENRYATCIYCPMMLHWVQIEC